MSASDNIQGPTFAARRHPASGTFTETRLRAIATQLGASWDQTRLRRQQRRDVRRWLATNPPSRGRRTGTRC